MEDEKTIEVYAITDSNISYDPGYFAGIYLFFLVIGEIGSKHSSIFTVEYEGHRLPVIYSGICPVLKNDKLRITGKMQSGTKAGIQGQIMKASLIENMITGDIYHK